MKLKTLLAIIPENYQIGLMDADPDNYSMLVFGTRNDAILGFARKARMDPEQVANMTAITIHPRATACVPAGVPMYDDDFVELYVNTQLLIEIA